MNFVRLCKRPRIFLWALNASSKCTKTSNESWLLEYTQTTLQNRKNKSLMI